MESKQSYQSFTELAVWQAARGVKNDVFALIKTFPSEERYRLADQLVRASRSVCANISEGHGRYTYKDQLRFCVQARGSLSETMNHLLDALDCAYIDETSLAETRNKIEQTAKLLNGYITFLRNSIKQQND